MTKLLQLEVSFDLPAVVPVQRRTLDAVTYDLVNRQSDMQRLDSDGDETACKSLPLGWRVIGRADLERD